MASLGRARRGHLSSRVPNVKLRPAPAQDVVSSRRMRGPNGDEEVNMMDKELVRRMEQEDTVDDTHDPELAHAKVHLPFSGQNICFTGLQSEKPELMEKLRSLGVKEVKADLTLECTGLISKGFDGLKYERSVEFRIPIFRPDWIRDVHDQWLTGAEIPPVQTLDYYRLKAFEGLTIAVSGIEPQKRQQIISEISLHGGTYSPNLHRTCTHLIVSEPKPNSPSPLDSAKVRWAMQVNAQILSDQSYNRRARDDWESGGRRAPEPETRDVGGRIRVVWEGWLWDCIKFGGRFREELWDAEETEEPPEYEQTYSGKEELRNKRREEVLREREMIEQSMRPREPEEILEKKPGDIDMADMEALKSRPDQLEQAVIRKRPRDASQEDYAAPQGKRASNLQAFVQELVDSVKIANPVAMPEFNADLGRNRADSPVFASPGGGRKRARMAVVPGVKETPPTWAPRPAGTSAAELGGYTKPSIANTTGSSLLRSSREDAFSKAEAGPSKVPAHVVEPEGNLKLADQTTIEAAPSNSTSTQDTRVFAGLKFTHQIAGPVKTFEDAIQANLGTLIPYSDWQAGNSVDYVVYRLSGPQPPKQPHSSNAQNVTECWIERCLKERRLCPLDDSIVFRPLGASMPVSNIKGVVIHVSGFDEENKYYLGRLIRALGAEFASGLSKTKTTHLVSAQSSGIKMIKATEWKIPTVSREWMYAMARTGTLEPIDPYILTLEPEGSTGPSSTVPQPSTNARIKLASAGTMNLSTISDAGSAFGLGMSARPGSPTLRKAIAERALSEATVDKSELSENRKLGLNPTEIELDTGKPGRFDSVSTTDTRSRSVSGSNNSGATSIAPQEQAMRTPIRTDSSVSVAPALPALADRKSRQQSEPAVATGNNSPVTPPVIAPEIWAQLNQQVEPKLHHNPRRNRARGRSGASSRTTNPFLQAVNNFDHDQAEHPNDNENDNIGIGDESMRVVYVDPKADLERKKLLDAFQARGPPERRTRSRQL